MVERVMRLNEQELNLIEASMKFLKKDIEKDIEQFKDCGKRKDESAYIKAYEDVLGQADAMLKRIEDIK